MNIMTHSAAILEELRQVAERLDPARAARLAELIGESRGIFVAGCGRSGLMARAFAMRLMHLGRTAWVVGETATPAIGRGDLLIVCSGKGDKHSLLGHMRQAAAAGAACAAITAAVRSPIAREASCVVELPAGPSRQFGGSLFEQSLLIFLDSLFAAMAEAQGADHGRMAARHANLE